MGRRPRAAHRAAPIAVLAAAAILTACGDRRLGWGVVLWAPQPGIGGSVLSISDESDLRDVYRHATAGAAASGELARWRVRLFADREQADEFAAAFSGLVNTFGYAARSGLPVRSAADAGAAQLYRLREGEAVKIVAREAEPAAVGPYINFWYHVLTSDGTAGFTYGEFLPLFDTEGDPQTEADRLRSEDSPWDRIAAAAWRPRYYAAMLASGRVDLRRIDPAYGFAIELAGQPAGQPADAGDGAGAAEGPGGTARVRLPGVDAAFPYRRVDRVGEGIFVLQDAGVRIAAENGRSIAVSFRDRGRLRTEPFVLLDTPVEDVIAAERARRDRIYDALRADGPALRSDAYGQLVLEPARRFRWSGFDRLVPAVAPADATGTGAVELRLHVAAALRAEYAGALTLAFDRGDRSAPPAAVTFLYSRDDAGLRLVPAGEVDENRLLVTGVASAPLVIYFRFAG